MKEIDELNLPNDVHYAESHEWVKPDNEKVRIGISDYAQNQLGDIVFVELPEIGDTLDKGSEFGTVESVKAVSELYMPLSGEVVSINSELEDSPELVNKNAYDDGWMIEIKPNDLSEIDNLMTKDAYVIMLKGLE